MLNILIYTFTLLSGKIWQGEFLCGGSNVAGGISREGEVSECARKCDGNSKCVAWTFKQNSADDNCWLKTSAHCTGINKDYKWGMKNFG